MKFKIHPVKCYKAVISPSAELFNRVKNSQRGISLIIVFLVMTVMLSVVLGFNTILFNKIRILGNIGDSISSSYAAESGLEKTLYFDRKQIPKKGDRGLCDICNACPDCDSCIATALSANGCDPLTCSDCEISYKSAFNGRTYMVSAKATPSLFFSCDAKGEYKNTTRTINAAATSILSIPIEQ